MIGSYLDKDKQTSGAHDFHWYTETELKNCCIVRIVSAILLVDSTTRRETPLNRFERDFKTLRTASLRVPK